MREQGGSSFYYHADELGSIRLVADAAGNIVNSYSYDAEGNRVTSHLSSSHMTDDANRLLSDDTFTYTYDANGNLTSKTEIVGGATTTRASRRSLPS